MKKRKKPKSVASRGESDNNEAIDKLTDRERECYLCLLLGRGIKEIAAALNITSSTVEKHMASIKNKLNCRSKSSLFDYAKSIGMLDINTK